MHVEKPQSKILVGHQNELLVQSWMPFFNSLLRGFEVKLKQASRFYELQNEVGGTTYDLYILFLDNILVPKAESVESMRTKILDLDAVIKTKSQAPVAVCSNFDDAVLKDRVGFAGADFFFVVPVELEDLRPAVQTAVSISGKVSMTKQKRLKPLKALDERHVRAAEGWLGLGNHKEANRELEDITPAFRSHPNVLEVRWQIFARAKKWEACVDIGSALVEAAPHLEFGWVHRSLALHELKRTTEAAELLLPAVQLFPKSWLIRYNLACYAAQLGNAEETWEWLEDAFELGDPKLVKLLALNDQDLSDFWAEIGEVY